KASERPISFICWHAHIGDYGPQYGHDQGGSQGGCDEVIFIYNILPKIGTFIPNLGPKPVWCSVDESACAGILLCMGLFFQKMKIPCLHPSSPPASQVSPRR